MAIWRIEAFLIVMRNWDRPHYSMRQTEFYTNRKNNEVWLSFTDGSFQDHVASMFQVAALIAGDVPQLDESDTAGFCFDWEKSSWDSRHPGGWDPK